MPLGVRIALVGIGALFALEAIALLLGRDGVLYAAVGSGIGAIIGYAYKSYRNKKEHEGPRQRRMR